MMRRETPSGKWMDKWIKEFGENGGHIGYMTLKALAPRAEELYRAGATPKVAGMACAKEYQLYSSREQLQEAYGDLKREVRTTAPNAAEILQYFNA